MISAKYQPLVWGLYSASPILLEILTFSLLGLITPANRVGDSVRLVGLFTVLCVAVFMVSLRVVPKPPWRPNITFIVMATMIQAFNLFMIWVGGQFEATVESM